MKNSLLLIAAGSLALSPASLAAQTAPGQGQFNGTGWDHMTGPDSTGQPNVECEDLIEEGEGGIPGGAFNGKSAFGGFAHEKYAGEQDQNSRNTASSSQYDTACLHRDPE
jgi:hypothetical protein